MGSVRKNIEMLAVEPSIYYCLLSLQHLREFNLQIDIHSGDVLQDEKIITMRVPMLRGINSSLSLTNIGVEGFKQDEMFLPGGKFSPPSSLKYINPTFSAEEFPPQKNGEGELNVLLSRFTHIFSEDKYDIGCIRLQPQKVVLTSELPIALRPYRAPPQDNKEIEEQINKLLEANIIRPSHSPFAAPITLVMKKDEGKRTRMCVDFRKLNQITKTDSEPVPRIDALLDQLTQAKYFSTLDLTSGYWHIQIDDKDAEKLAFTSQFGLFEFLRLPFGWKNAPNIFQRTIRQILNK